MPPPVLTAVDRAEPLTDPIALGEDTQLSRSLSFPLAHVLSGPPLQLTMNVGDQNGLEPSRLLERSEQPMAGANRNAAVQSILQFKLSPGFDKLEEELRENVSCDHR